MKSATRRRPRTCFVGAIPLKHAPQHQYMVCRTPPRCVLSPNIARFGAATLITAGAALRLHGQHVAGRLFGLTALAVTSMVVLKGTRQPATQAAPTGRFSGSRAAWDSSDDEDAKTGAATSGLTRGMLGLARTLLKEVLVPLLDALRLLIADMRTRRRHNDSYFMAAPPRTANRTGGDTRWSWQPPTATQHNDSKQPLSVEERQVRALGDTARRAAESARGGAQKARDALRNLLDGFT